MATEVTQACTIRHGNGRGNWRGVVEKWHGGRGRAECVWCVGGRRAAVAGTRRYAPAAAKRVVRDAACGVKARQTAV